MSSKKRVRGERLYMFMNLGAGMIPVGASTDCSLAMSSSPIEVSKRGQGRWRAFRAGKCQWSMAVNGFYVEKKTGIPDNILSAASAIGTKVGVAMSILSENIVALGIDLGTITPSTHTLMGEAFITDCEYTGSKGGFATYKIALQGSGELTPVSE